MADHTPDTPTASFAPPPTTTAAFAPAVPADFSPSTADTLPQPGGGPFARPHPVGHRFTIGELIARGGMGEVYRAADRELDRKVAVKVLAERLTANPLMARRFLNEARLCGRLQHPGIVPVYALGELPDGRPFFAMKLVEGETLAKQLAARTTPHAGLPRFLQIFEQVCQAVGYAHSQGVIHRDLKPDNVMVGAFGEVQVMDWGLAKELGERRGVSPPVEPAEPHPSEVPGCDLTQHGSVMGTPAFMPPEQAAGDPDRVDRRSDVFGLGGVLCVTLTGKPPYVAPDTRQALASAARGDLADAFSRLDECGADAELVALCKRCLSANPDDRPADAAAVASAVFDYRASVEERARQADLERAKADARSAAERKRRKAQLVLAAVVALSAAVTTVALRWYAADRERKATAARQQLAARDAEARVALKDAWEARKAGWLSGKDPAVWGEKLAVARQALDRIDRIRANGDLSAEVDADVTASRAEVDADDRERAFVERLEAWNLKAETARLTMLEGPVAAEFAEFYLTLFRDFGLDPAAADFAAVGERLRARSAANDRVFGRLPHIQRPVLDPLLDAIDHWKGLTVSTLNFPFDRFEAIGRLAHELEGQSEERIADAVLGPNAEEWFSTATPRQFRRAAGLRFERPDAAEVEVRVRRRLLARDPTDFRANFDLALRLLQTYHQTRPPTRDSRLALPEASRLLAAAAVARPTDPRGHLELALSLVALGDPAGADAAFRRAVAVTSDGFDERTEYAEFLCKNLRFAEALPLLAQAVDIATRPDQKVYLPLRRTTVEVLALKFADSGRLTDWLDARRHLIRFDPSAVGPKIGLADALFRAGREPEAVAQYEAGLAAAEAAGRRHEVGEYISYASLVEALRWCGRYAEAAEAVERYRRILGPEPVWADRLREASERVARDRAAAERLAKFDPKAELPADRNLARAAFQTGKFELAAGILARYLDRVPKHILEHEELRALARAGATDVRWRDLARKHLRKQVADCRAGWYEGAGGKRIPLTDLFITARLTWWLAFPDLAGIRDEDGLIKLPAAEQAEWRELWADVRTVQDAALRRHRRLPPDAVPPAAK